MSGKGMLCGGNIVIMCGTCDMGRKSVFQYDPLPPPPRGGHPRKKYPARYQPPPPLDTK